MDVNQHYPFEARQMQALSLAVHIPLVCFGIAFPLTCCSPSGATCGPGTSSTGRWRGGGRGHVALFAVGVVTGTILSLRARAAVAGVDTGLWERVWARVHA